VNENKMRTRLLAFCQQSRSALQIVALPVVGDLGENDEIEHAVGHVTRHLHFDEVYLRKRFASLAGDCKCSLRNIEAEQANAGGASCWVKTPIDDPISNAFWYRASGRLASVAAYFSAS
jgi:hypothetical protein